MTPGSPVSTRRHPCETTHVCEKCIKFRCPLVMRCKDEVILGCDRDIMEQIFAGKNSKKSKDFRIVCRELGL